MKYVILGASAAGVNAIGAIRALDGAGEIVLISEDDAVYSRCILHHFIGGERDEKALGFIDDDFFSRNNVNWKRGVSALSVDSAKKKIPLSDGTSENYDKLLIATGASTAFPPIPGMRGSDGTLASGVYGLRTLPDARAIKAAAQKAQTVAVIGAGLIGIDAASGLLKLRKRVTIIEGKGNMLPLQLDAEAAAAYQDQFARQGGAQYYNAMVQEITHGADGAVDGVKLAGGARVPCDMFICAAGVKANFAFLEGSCIQTDGRGLAYNERGETNAPDVYGAGDVSGKSPIWPLAVKEGIIAGTNMAGGSAERESFFASKSAMSFWGVKTLSLGVHTAPDETYSTEITRGDGSYKKIIHKDGKIYGALIQGDLSYAGVLTQLIAEKIDVSRVKKPLFKIDYSDFFALKDNFEFMYA